MSHLAQGWCQRQQLGDPIAKAVLQSMCYVLRDETLLVYIGIPRLEEYTEYEDRAIRKAIQRLVELGMLLDTGRKKNNVTIWRIPAYEAWLAASPPAKGRASSTDTTALAQLAELAKAKKVVLASDSRHPPIREGLPTQALPSTQPSPPVDVPQALPSTGGNPKTDLNRSLGSDDPRANPSGSRTPLGNEARRSHWRVFACNHVISECRGLGITAYGVNQWKQLPTNVRMLMRDKVEALVDWAVNAETELIPKKNHEISAHVYSAITLELRAFKPPTPAEQQASAEDPQFDDDRAPASGGR